ncbi:7977_t:CDS:2, partial [Cetraspora pellucida]
AMNSQVCKSTKSTPYKLVFGQEPYAELSMISMLYQQNIIQEEDIPLENQLNNQTNLITNNERSSPLIENYIEVQSNIIDNDVKSPLKENYVEVQSNIIDVDERSSSLMENYIEVQSNIIDDDDLEDKNLSNNNVFSERMSQANYTDTDTLYEDLSSNNMPAEDLLSQTTNSSPIEGSSQASFNNHKSLRDAAIKHVKKNRQVIRNIMGKRHKTKRSLNLNPGDFVKIRVPNIDKQRIDRRALPYKWYPANELEPLGTNEYPALDIIPLGAFISLRNAATQQNLTRPLHATKKKPTIQDQATEQTTEQAIGQ